MQDILIIGAGGFGREVEEIIQAINRVKHVFNLLGFVDDNVESVEAVGSSSPIISKVSNISQFENVKFVIALGDPIARQNIANKVLDLGFSLQTIIHPSAVISPSAQIGSGVIVCPFAFIGTNSRVGNNVVFNVYSSLGHDSVVEEHCVLSPYAALTGNVHVGNSTFVGTGTLFSPGINIGEKSKISIGTVVTKDVEPGSLVMGNPSRSRVMFQIE